MIAPEPAQSQPASRPQQPELKLPKLRLETLCGELATWQSFWECFREAVHENDGLSKTEKFHYLKSFLSGVAMSAVQGLQATEACYDNAVEILQRRFGDTGKLEQEHLSQSRSLPQVSSSGDVSSLRRMFDHVQTHIRGLLGLGISPSTYSAMLCDILTPLPRDMAVDFHRQASRTSRGNTAANGSSSTSSLTVMAAGMEGRLSELLKSMLVETESREWCKQDAPPKEIKNRTGAFITHQPSKTSSATELHSQQEGEQCFFCGDVGHWTADCGAPLKREDRQASKSQEVFSLHEVGAAGKRVLEKDKLQEL